MSSSKRSLAWRHRSLTPRRSKHTFDNLNRFFVESLDNAGLDKLVKSLDKISAGSGSLKRVQAALETTDSGGTVSAALLPFYVLYDLRITYSHLTSADTRTKLLATAASRLALPADPPLSDLYDALLARTINALETLTGIVR